MKIPIVLTTSIMLLAVVTPSEAVYDDTFYVRADGNDQWCSGTVDAAWNNNPSPSNCAKKTITSGLALCDHEGDLLKIYSNTTEGVLFNEAPVVTDPNVTIEGYGGSGRPRIGNLETFTSGWSNTSDDVYTRTYASDSNFPIWGAYLDLKYIGSPKNYEHERMGLIRSDGHYLRGGYDVQHAEQESGEKTTKAVLRGVQRGRGAACA